LSDQPEWGGIGPLGLSKEMRGLGAGLGVVAAGMRHLYQHGLKFARIDWTTLVDFYGRLGFKPSLKYRRASKPFVPKVEG
jgi:predicted N-acetyltransferase YhbS